MKKFISISKETITLPKIIEKWAQKILIIKYRKISGEKKYCLLIKKEIIIKNNPRRPIVNLYILLKLLLIFTF